MGEVGDYILSHLNVNQMQSRFNQREFSYSQLVNLSHEWHDKMSKSGGSRVGASGRLLIDLGGGWKWVALDRGYCEREGKAAGHCGNIGAGEYDNIYSLRDDRDQVHLTFVSNGGVLGEMKGRGNSKPSSRYHSAILKLLLSDNIGAIEGGGYAPENNFSLSDLSKSDQELVRSKKPYIDDPYNFRKYREKFSRGYLSSVLGKGLRAANTDEELEFAIEKLVWKKLDSDKVGPYDLKDRDYSVYIPDQVQGKNLWKGFEDLLNETYNRSRGLGPRELFSWMDRAIKIFVKHLAKVDLKNYDDGNSFGKNLFPYYSNIMKLFEVSQKLLGDQPEVLRGAPSRSSYGDWDDYYADLTDYMDGEGYDLPPWNPNNNHIISYEFMRRLYESLHEDALDVVKILDDIYSNDSVMRRLGNFAYGDRNDGSMFH